MTAEEYYEKQRRKGLTEDITGDPEPDYSLPFYQNIFKIMEGYQSQLKELLPSDEEVVQQRELLLAFADFLRDEKGTEFISTPWIDKFLKANNCA